ncbi:MAG: twitching motility protein PilT [Campylobacter sp.]|nr:twitching motility protein PilT [Campylobacter sp.]
MAKIFLDSNILIDFLVEERGALNLAAVKLFENFSASDTICYSFGSISDAAYVLKKCYKISEEIILDFFSALSRTANFKCLSLPNDGLLLACEYANDKTFPKLQIALRRTDANLEDYAPKQKI